MNNLQVVVKDNTRFAMHMAVELCESGDFDSVSEAFAWLMAETPDEHGTDMVSDLKDLVFEYSACALREGCDGCGHRTGLASCEIEERALALGIEVVEV